MSFFPHCVICILLNAWMILPKKLKNKIQVILSINESANISITKLLTKLPLRAMHLLMYNLITEHF